MERNTKKGAAVPSPSRNWNRGARFHFKKRSRYDGRTPGAFVPLLLSSGGILQTEMKDAWTEWGKKEKHLWKKLASRISLVLIEYRAHANIWNP